MAWDVAVTWVDGSVPDAADFNDYFQAPGKYLKGDGETVTHRDLIVFAPDFKLADADDCQLRHTYNPTGSEFRVLDERTFPSSRAIANGDTVTLSMLLEGEVAGIGQSLGYWKATRVSSGNGSLGYYHAGLTTPVYFINESNQIGINQALAAYAVDVYGTVRGAQYRVAGSTIGNWALVGHDMSYTGNARATGQLTSLATSSAPVAVASTTMVSNLNAAKLRGATWPVDAADRDNGTALAGSDEYSVYAPIIASVVAAQAGWYLIIGEASFIASGAYSYLGALVNGMAAFDAEDYATSVTQYHVVSSLVSGSREQIHVCSLYEAAEEDVIWLRCYSDPAVSVTGSVTAIWLAPSTNIRPTGLTLTFAFGAPTVNVT